MRWKSRQSQQYFFEERSVSMVFISEAKQKEHLSIYQAYKDS